MVWPCLLVICELMASRCLRWSGCKGGVYVTIGFVFIMVPCLMLNEGLRALETAANSSDVALGVQVALIPAGVLVGVAVSAGRCPKRLSRGSRKSPPTPTPTPTPAPTPTPDVDEVPQTAACFDADDVWHAATHGAVV